MSVVRQDKTKSGRVTPKASAAAVTGEANVTAADNVDATSVSKVSRQPVKVREGSPLITPILMFGLWGLGAAVLLANYIVRDFAGMPSNWYLVIGLLLVLLGFIPATRFR